MSYIQEQGQVHQKMLSEREICKQFGVSRTTVRTALRELESLGYIYKRHGKGTFISGQWKDRQNLLEGYSFTEQTKAHGKVPTTLIRQFDRYPADPYIATQLGLDPGEEIIRLKRIRCADGIPMMKETTFLPGALFPRLDVPSLTDRSLYELLATDYGQQIIYADEEFSASLLTEEEAAALEDKAGQACLRLKRTTLNRDNRIIEFTLSVAKSDQFFYKVRHYRSS